MTRGRAGAASAHALALLAVVALGALVYAGTLDSPFVFDDQYNITQNERIRVTSFDPAALRDAAFGHVMLRPVAYLSFAANYALGGYDPTGYHVANIAIHLANGVLVYWLAWLTLGLASGRRAGGAAPAATAAPADAALVAAAGFAALVFVSHPVQTQAVTYIVQRMTSLATGFTLLALLLFVAGRLRDSGRVRALLWSGAALSWLLALGSKEIAATLPAIVLLYEWMFFRDASSPWLRRHAHYGVALLATVALLALLYADAERSSVFSDYSRYDFTLRERLLTEPRVVVFYISLLFFPAPSRLNLIHDFPVSRSLLEPATTLLSLVLLAGLLVLAAFLVRRDRVASFCILWFLGNLVLESSVIPLDLVFEHRLYLPNVGFALLAGELLRRGFRWRRVPALALAAACLLALGVATYARNAIWRDAIALWSDVASKSPGSVRALNNLGLACVRAGRYDEAERHYRQALRLDPQHRLARTNLGIALAAQGRLEEAARFGVLAPGAVPQHAALALRNAALRGDARMVRQLLAHGADPDGHLGEQGTALHVAVRRGDSEIAELLLAAGADVAARGPGGTTPLHRAAARGHTELVGLLLAHGAPADDRLESGETALLLAQRGGHAEVVALLQEADAQNR